LDRAVADRSDERRDARMQEAKANSWDARFARIDGLIGDALARRAETGRSGD
jgi:hypothetical protein